MKRILLLLLLQVPAIVCFADEYKDPVTNVIYTYDPAGDRAEVKQGGIYYNDYGEMYPISYPGSPEAKAEIVILDRFIADGKEYIVDRIGNYAFTEMNNVASVVIPYSVNSIGKEAFCGCVSLSTVELAEGLKSIEKSAFVDCAFTAVSLPETLEEIGAWAFYLCTKLESISIPPRVTNIGVFSFEYCYELSTITSFIEQPFEVDDICEASLQKQITLYVPSGTKSKYEATSGWQGFRTIEERQPTGITSPIPSPKSCFYDLQGRKLSGKPAHGIYIEDGKKKVK